MSTPALSELMPELLWQLLVLRQKLLHHQRHLVFELVLLGEVHLRNAHLGVLGDEGGGRNRLHDDVFPLGVLEHQREGFLLLRLKRGDKP